MWVLVGMRGCARGCLKCAWVCPRICGSVQVCAIVCGYTLVFVLVCIGVCGYARVCACVWDEFSEFLPETRVLTSADFNTYPIRIFYTASPGHRFCNRIKATMISYIEQEKSQFDFSSFVNIDIPLTICVGFI